MSRTLRNRRLRCRQLSLWVLWPTILALAVDVQSAEPPRPYTPVEATPGEFRSLGRVTELEDLQLPVQITAAQQPLLAGPIRLFSDPDVFALAKGAKRVVSNAADSATWQSSSE